MCDQKFKDWQQGCRARIRQKAAASFSLQQVKTSKSGLTTTLPWGAGPSQGVLPQKADLMKW